jgi:penicillin-binding protein 2
MRRRHKKLGFAFSEEVMKVTSTFGHFQKNRHKNQDWTDIFVPNYEPEELSAKVSAWRVVALGSIFLIIFFGLFLRLFHLQVVQGADNRQRADLNRIAIKVIHATRGVIYDRNGKVLAESNPGFRLKEDQNSSSYKLISRDEALSLEAKNSPQLNDLEIDAIRFYPYGPVTSHILGYVGQISPEELKKPEFSGSNPYKIGDRIGRSGIEQIYESTLRGKDGAEIIEIDAKGQKLRTLRTVQPVPGQNVYLSVDVDLQKTVYESLKKGMAEAESCCGAAVAENPKTGEVLAMVSLPSYDSNAFNDPKRSKEVEGYFQDESSPLLNRAISGVYPPGSTFKIASALAGLSSGKITKKTEIEDTGVMSLGPYTFSNWYFTSYGRKEGFVNVIKALQRSNDIFFYKVGDMVGVKTLGDTAKKIGMGKKLGIDLPGEADGLIPDESWKEKNTGQVWYPGDNLHMAIGQGFLLTTPLQVLAQTGFIAADGNLIQPHLGVKITSAQGNTVKQFHFDPIVKNIFKKEDLETVKEGMIEVPKDGGTAWPFFAFSVPTAGKTGTAEFGDPKNKTHAWYTSYAPVDEPQIALTVLVEAGGEGSSVSAPISKDIYTWYFNPDKAHLKSLDKAAIATESARQLGE